MKQQSYRDIETDHAYVLAELKNERLKPEAMVVVQRVLERALALARERVER